MTNRVNSRTVAACPSDVANAARPAPKRDRSQDLDDKWSSFKPEVARRGIGARVESGLLVTMVQMPCAYCGHGAKDSHACVVDIDRIDSSVKKCNGMRNCVPFCSTCHFESVVGPVCLSEHSSSNCRAVGAHSAVLLVHSRRFLSLSLWLRCNPPLTASWQSYANCRLWLAVAVMALLQCSDVQENTTITTTTTMMTMTIMSMRVTS